MGSWGAAAIVFTEDARRVDAKLSALGAVWGRTRFLKPRARTTEQWDPMQYADGDGAAHWGFAAVPSKGACLLVSAPPLLLLEQAENGQTRLVSLARALGCACAFVRLADACLSIVEVDAQGALAASGSGEPRGPHAVGDVDLPPQFSQPAFRLIDVPAEVNAALASHFSADAFATALQLLAPGCPPPHLLQQSLLAHKKVPRPNARTIYFRRRPERSAGADIGTFALKLEPHEEGFSISAAEGAARLHGHALEADSATAGAPLLAAIAQWLELPVPAVPEHGVTAPVFTQLAPYAEALPRPGITTEVMTLGERKPVSLLLHRAVRGEHAELELRERSLGARLLERLTPALVGRQGRHARVRKLTRPALPDTQQLRVAAAGDRFVAGCWKKSATALFEVGGDGAIRALGDVPGVITGICSLGARVALSVTDPIFKLGAGKSPGVGPDCPSRVMVMGPGDPRVVLDGTAAKLKFSYPEMVGSPDGLQLAMSIHGPGHTRQTLVIDAETGAEIDRAPELVDASPVLWDAEGLLLRGRDRKSFADRWFRWQPLGEARSTDVLFTSSSARAVKPTGLAGCFAPLGPLLRSGDLLGVRSGLDPERAALYDAATGTAIDLFPVDGLALAAIASHGLLAATQNDSRLYLGSLTPH